LKIRIQSSTMSIHIHKRRSRKCQPFYLCMHCLIFMQIYFEWKPFNTTYILCTYMWSLGLNANCTNES
jgi:hypothetical protein